MLKFIKSYSYLYFFSNQILIERENLKKIPSLLLSQYLCWHRYKLKLVINLDNYHNFTQVFYTIGSQYATDF